MDAKTFLDEKGEDRCKEVAEAAGSTLGYFKQIAYGHRRPSVGLAERMVDSSAGELDLLSLLKSKVIHEQLRAYEQGAQALTGSAAPVAGDGQTQ